MVSISVGLRHYVRRVASKSSFLLAAVAIVITGAAQAHEVTPAVGDVTVTPESVRAEISITAESMVSGIDLSAVEDTNESPLAGYYDQLRAMPPEELRERFDAIWPRLAEGIYIEVDGARIPPTLEDLRIPQVGNTDLVRESVLVIAAPLPAGDAPVVMGWSPTYGPLVLRQTGEGDALYSGYLTPGQMSDPLPREGVAQLSAASEFFRYIVIGVEHIIPKGLDHILFVLGLFFFSLHWRPLLGQVTTFTLAHTVTLALASLGLVTVSPAIVEPLIAASIVVVALENVLGFKMGWHRVIIIFVFGLLHGLGFATVLGEIGLNPSRFVADLIAFNIGVEVGQLAVIAAAYLAVGAWFGSKPWYRARIAVPASVVIAAVGAYWFVERVFL